MCRFPPGVWGGFPTTETRRVGPLVAFVVRLRLLKLLRVPMALEDKPEFSSHLLHPGDAGVRSRLLCPVQELEDGKDGGDGATHHRHQEHARHVAEAKRVDPTPTFSSAGAATTLLLPPLHFQPVQGAPLL